MRTYDWEKSRKRAKAIIKRKREMSHYHAKARMVFNKMHL